MGNEWKGSSERVFFSIISLNEVKGFLLFIILFGKLGCLSLLRNKRKTKGDARKGSALIKGLHVLLS